MIMAEYVLTPTEADLAIAEMERRKREEWERKHPVQAYIKRRKQKRAYEKSCKRYEFLHSHNKPNIEGYFLISVQRGDSLVSISKKYYGCMSKHLLISEDNCNINGTEIRVGDELYIRRSEAISEI